jgi:hypothetical protein
VGEKLFLDVQLTDVYIDDAHAGLPENTAPWSWLGNYWQLVRYVTVAAAAHYSRSETQNADGSIDYYDIVQIDIVECLMPEWVDQQGTRHRAWLGFVSRVARKSIAPASTTLQTAGPALYGTRLLAAAAANGATEITLDGVLGQLCPPVVGVINPDTMGLDTSKAPADGRVPVYRAGDVIVIADQQITALPSPLAAGQQVALRAGLDVVQLEDQDGLSIPLDRYSVDLAAGKITFAAPLDLTAYRQPLLAIHRIEQMRGVRAVDVAGKKLKLTTALGKAFAAGAQVAAVLELGDLQAAYRYLFEQSAWTGVWANAVAGGTPTAQYDDVTYPLLLQNRSAISECWRIHFVSESTVHVIGQTLGQVLTGVGIASDIAPINPATGLPYFRLDRRGWSAGWQAGNVLRFNTLSAKAPLWLLRSTLPSEPFSQADGLRLMVRGSVRG